MQKKENNNIHTLIHNVHMLTENGKQTFRLCLRYCFITCPFWKLIFLNKKLQKVEFFDDFVYTQVQNSIRVSLYLIYYFADCLETCQTKKHSYIHMKHRACETIYWYIHLQCLSNQTESSLSSCEKIWWMHLQLLVQINLIHNCYYIHIEGLFECTIISTVQQKSHPKLTKKIENYLSRLHDLSRFFKNFRVVKISS